MDTGEGSQYLHLCFLVKAKGRKNRPIQRKNIVKA